MSSPASVRPFAARRPTSRSSSSIASGPSRYRPVSQQSVPKPAWGYGEPWDRSYPTPYGRSSHRSSPESPKARGGRPRIPARHVLSGILVVLRSGISWQLLPQELGCRSGMTCWRRLREWQIAGVWERLHHELLNRLHNAGKIDWSRASSDSASIPIKAGGDVSSRRGLINTVKGTRCMGSDIHERYFPYSS